jgi:hypothetical protein
MLDSAAEFCIRKLFRNNSVSGKTRNEWHAPLYPSTQEADATLANLLGFGSNRNCQEQNYSGSSSLLLAVERVCKKVPDEAQVHY